MANYDQRGERNPNWVRDPSPATGRSRAAAWFVMPSLCGACNEVAPIDRHHKNGDATDNCPGNVAFLCRRCHMRADGRLAAFVAVGKSERQPQDPKPCRQCGHSYKPLRKGLCARCYDRKRERRRQRVG